MVYLKMQLYRETSLGLRNALKLTSNFYGPFKILAKNWESGLQIAIT
jgi:hypothetical protein